VVSSDRIKLREIKSIYWRNVMRLLHPETLRVIALDCNDDDFKYSTVSRKQIISHALKA
jgi:hypothetical protein